MSGVLIAPTVGTNANRPVVAWAHPTSGVTTACAPSLSRGVYRQIQGLEQLLQQGFAVIATDYPGLGGPGVHPYLIGDSEGCAVLDSVRAARERLGQRDPTRFAVWGHSQGGQAALYAGLLASNYGAGTRARRDSGGGAGHRPFHTYSRRLRFKRRQGADGADIVVLVEGIRYQARQDSRSQCHHHGRHACRRLHRDDLRPFGTTFRGATTCERFSDGHRHQNGRALERTVKAKHAGVLPREIPVFVAQGLADGIVRPEVTISYVRRLCSHGSSVDFVALPKVGHGFIARDTAKDAAQWIGNRFAGPAAPNSCAQPPQTVPGD